MGVYQCARTTLEQGQLLKRVGELLPALPAVPSRTPVAEGPPPALRALGGETPSPLRA